MKKTTQSTAVLHVIGLLALQLLLSSCSQPTDVKVATTPAEATNSQSQLDIAYEQYQLANGLKVILHQDTSDPIVAMATVVHVGSNREKPGRTGFAHFFEHMSFNDSENVPKGSNRKLIPELGGTRNGGTWSDGTIYYEVVPKDAFDKLLWIDSDRLGYMINTVDQGTLEREKQVVKNEKRQRVDNRPYGHTDHVIKKALYPTEHPYNWTVIGDLADLQAASLDDVREFYNTYYVPANATLVIAGDIDIAQTKSKVEAWFGEIKAGKLADPIKPQPVQLKENKKLYHLDTFAQLPEIRLTFSGVEQYHRDAYALDILGTLLSSGKNAALYKTIVADKKLAPDVSAYNSSDEVAGKFTISIRANANAKLDDVYTAINESLTDFEKNGFTENQLNKIKAESETDFYYNIESILDKALQLGIYNEYAGSPNFIKQDLANIVAVTPADVKRVFTQYIKNKPAIITSFVPKHQPELILTGSAKADVAEEQIIQGAEETFVEKAVEYTKTTTKFDRSEPKLSDLPTLHVPKVWQGQLKNGVKLYGIEQTELPVVNFNLRINAGQQLDLKDKIGTAKLMTELMNEGTMTKTPQALEEAIGLLGARLYVSSNFDSVTISGRTLAKNFTATIHLLKEMLLAPRWDPVEFERLKAARLTRIQQAKGDAGQIARNAFMKVIYGQQHVAGNPLGGDESSVAAIQLNDLKTYYQTNLSPQNASFHAVGAITQKDVEQATKVLLSWQGDKITIPKQPQVAAVSQPKLYFIDLPDAKQSVIYTGKASLPADHPDAYAIQVANTNLGGGMSARLAQTLRIQKGYTYGAYSYLDSFHFQSPFIATSQVRANVTLESLQIVKELIGNYQSSFTDDDLKVTQNMIIKGDSRRFETLDQLLRMLDFMSDYQLPHHYIEDRQDYVKALTLSAVHKTIEHYLNEKEMIYLVVGDAKTQLSRMKDLGYGEPIVLDVNGELIK